MGIAIDSSGSPVNTTLTFPSVPLSLAVSGLYILAACQDGVYVYDRTTAAWAQTLPYPEGAVPAPGQPVLCAANFSGSCIAIAGLRKVWACSALKHPVQDDCRIRLPASPACYGQYQWLCLIIAQLRQMRSFPCSHSVF